MGGHFFYCYYLLCWSLNPCLAMVFWPSRPFWPCRFDHWPWRPQLRRKWPCRWPLWPLFWCRSGSTAARRRGRRLQRPETGRTCCWFRSRSCSPSSAVEDATFRPVRQVQNLRMKRIFPDFTNTFLGSSTDRNEEWIHSKCAFLSVVPPIPHKSPSQRAAETQQPGNPKDWINKL